MKNPAWYLKPVVASVILFWGTMATGQPRVAEGVSKMIDQINGRPSWQKLEDVEGSAYLSDKWNEGFVRFKDGQMVKNIPLKFNVKLNELYFQRNGQPFLFNTLPSDFSFGYSDEGKTKMAYYRCGYPPADNKTGDSYYEVLADGKVQLLKFSTVFIQKTKQVAYSSEANSKYVTKGTYYLFVDGKLVPAVLSKKSLLLALNSYRARAEEFINKNDAKLRSEESAVMLINYVNTGTGL